MTTRVSPVHTPPHTCIDRPHLPCDACEMRTETMKTTIDKHSRGLIKIAFRLGFRAALILVAPWHPISDEQIDSHGKGAMGEEYYQ